MILGALIFVTQPQVLTGLHSFVYRDFSLFGFPLAYYHKQCFWSADIPLWNPYNNCGLPFLAQWNTMVLYPPSLIYLMLPLPWSLGVFILVHQFFGGIGMFVLARRWTGSPLAAALAGVAFAFNGFTLNCLMWPNYSASMAWMPWVVYITARAWTEGAKTIATAGLVGAMQMLSGTPEVILFTWLLIAAVWVAEGWKSWAELWTGAWKAGLVAFVVAGLSAAQLLPFLELLQQSDRSAGFDKGAWALAPWGWANLFVPMFRGHPTPSGVFFPAQQNLMSSFYPGVAVILAGLLALFWVRNRRVWLLSGVTLLSFLFAMGEHTPLYGWLRTGFPHLGFMRYPSKAVIPTVLAWPLLAAYGIAAFQASAPELARRRIYTGMAVVVTGLLIMVGITLHAYFISFPDQNVAVVLRNAVARGGFLLAIAGGMWLLLTRDLMPRRLAFVQICLVMILCLDFATHTPPQNPTVDRETLTVGIPWLKHMKPRPTLGESRAMLSFTGHKRYNLGGTSNLMETHIAQRNGLFANLNLLEAMPKADGFYALYPRHERHIHYRIHWTDEEPRYELGRFLGLSQVTSPSNIVVWQHRTNYMPMITAGQSPVFAQAAENLKLIISTNFIPEKVVCFEPETRGDVGDVMSGAARIVSHRVTAHAVTAEVEAVGPSLVVLAQTYYPRWKAYVDGRPVKLLRANHAFQAVRVSAGKHRVELRYEDTLFYAGSIVSLLSFVGVGLVIVSRSRTRNALNQDSVPVREQVTTPGISQLPGEIGELSV
jgi:hypothetical protein